MTAPPASLSNTASQTVRTLASSIVQDSKTMFTWDPIRNSLHRTTRDAAYLCIDTPFFFMYTHSNYSALRRYMRQARLNKGKVNPEDFRDVDTNVLRESLIRMSQFKGPLQKIDFRFFYWMYAIMIGYVIYEGWVLNGLLEAKLEKSGSTLEERRSMFDDDYEEDVRPR